MFRLVLMIVFAALAARAFWRLIDGVVEGLGDRAPRGGVPQPGVQMVRDPVCGMYILPDRAVALDDASKGSGGSRRVFFCSAACRDKYHARTA